MNTMGVIFFAESEGTIHGFFAGRRKNYVIAPFIAQCLPRHAPSTLGLSKKSKSGKKVGGQNIVCPPGVEKWGGGHVPPAPHQIMPMMNTKQAV